jgi:hypothetical protein
MRALEALLIVTVSAWLAACAGDRSSQLTVPLARDPYPGVSCHGRSNWIGCDRVVLYVYLNRRVAHLRASIEGREVPMQPAGGAPTHATTGRASSSPPA